MKTVLNIVLSSNNKISHL